jgi:NAD(P)-dependent dehydrogenase (short-subunit alcohol dehydrogenase family)
LDQRCHVDSVLTGCRITPEEFRRVTEITYLGFFHGTMAALKSMRPAAKGASSRHYSCRVDHLAFEKKGNCMENFAGHDRVPSERAGALGRASRRRRATRSYRAALPGAVSQSRRLSLRRWRHCQRRGCHSRAHGRPTGRRSVPAWRPPKE